MPPPASLSYYMDECVRGPITDQLKLRGIDVLRAQDFRQGAVDEDVLSRATQLKRVLVTEDTDHLAIGRKYQRLGLDFFGIVFMQKDRVSIGQAVEDLEIVARSTNIEEWMRRVEHLPL